MPESRHKYLYERLGDQDFQQLVGALLTFQFPGFVPLPLRQADGGRDGVDPSRHLIYQVKWSASGKEKDPVTWLSGEVTRESEKIKRLAAEGMKKYVLVTNLESTGKPKVGTFDRINAKLDELAEEFGLDEMTCIWREALNPMVDNAPTETKWAYAEMLAGWDLIRYLISDQTDASKDSALRDLLRKVAAAQWEEDERIKFSQVELDRERVSDLFVDVPAELIRAPKRIGWNAMNSAELGGAAAYVAEKTDFPFTLVRGAPGQGKSTLTQLVCQAYRVAFLSDQTSDAAGSLDIKEPRFPIRFDLSDYAAWMQGYDVFDKSDSAQSTRGKRRKAAESTIESFLAELVSHLAGGRAITQEEIQEIFSRVPSMVVLDGLDEVGSVSERKRVVREINLFCARSKSYAEGPKAIVTTRPNSAALPEPDENLFEVISLTPLDPALRNEYLRKWCEVHGVRGNDSRTLRRNFTEKTREPYIGELAGNPMQLTILLFLLRQRGDATPNQRTELYDAYMDLLLAREANKHPASVRKHRPDLMEIVPFLGWYIQSRAEEDGHSGKMRYDEVEVAMKHFQQTYGKAENVVDELFEAATDRLWALTSKEEGTFEFEVLSLREYFAARFLYLYAGEGDHKFDRTLVFRELLTRPFWLNTVRFYAGNAAGSDIYVLEAGIKHELAQNSSKQVRVAAWSLLTDGVFNSRPRQAASVVDALTDDVGRPLLLAALDGKEVTPLPESSHAEEAWKRLTDEINACPEAPENYSRVRVIRDLLGLESRFFSWWKERLGAAVGTGAESAWLQIGAACEVAAGEQVDLPGLSAEDGEDAQAILNTGMIPAPSSPIEAQLLRAVLDGQCSETISVRAEPAQIAVALSPAEFFTFGPDSTPQKVQASSADRRSLAVQRLRRAGSDYAKIAALRRFRRGEKGSTFPWANTAAALRDQVGRCWLVSEIAIIGAASPLMNGFTQAPGTKALGSASHPATLIEWTRKKRADAQWWREHLLECQDDLALAEWVLALWGVARGGVIQELESELNEALDKVSYRLQRSIQIAAHRLSESGFLLPRPLTLEDSSGVLTTVLGSRSPTELTQKVQSSRNIEQEQKPLAAVARRAKWLKVDQRATYR